MEINDEFTISVKLPDMSPIADGGFFDEFFEWIASHKAPMEKEIKSLLRDYARTGHRKLKGRHYVNRTGRLKKSTKAEGSFGNDLKDKIALYVDLTQAPYGEWIITGKRRGPGGKGIVTWNEGKGDPFIDETMKVLEPKITQIIIDFFNEAIMEFTRRH